MFVFGLDVSYFPVGVDGSERAGSGATVNGFSISDGQTAGQWDSPVRKCFCVVLHIHHVSFFSTLTLPTSDPLATSYLTLLLLLLPPQT